MIVGIGVDMVDVPDFEKRLARGPLADVFSESERAYADGRPAHRAQILAGRWAAKEAFAKALGAGLRAQWPLDAIEVVREESGRPALRVAPALSHLLPDGAILHLSLTHTPAQAVAFVIIETLGP